MVRSTQVDNVVVRVGLCLVAALSVTAVLGILPLSDRPFTAGLTFLLVVLPVSIAWGYRYAVIASVLSGLGFAWLVPPWRHPWFSDSRDFVALSAFLVIGVVGSYLSDRARREAINARQGQAELQRYREQLEDLVRQRTAELVEARDRAEAANRSKSVFLANMSHELRTPLNAVLGFSSLMRNESGISEGQRKTLDIITRSGEHLLGLINDVLDVARIEAGTVTVTTAPCNLVEMARDITDMMRQRAEEKGLSLIFEQSSSVPPIVRIDAPKLRQILINLINNAIKFTERGTVMLHIDAQENGGTRTKMLTFEISDTGRGIAVDDQARIFEPFVQLGDAQARKGTGLGLTITRQYVELMGGTIAVESAVGEGACIRVEIPVETVSESELVQSGSHHRLVALMPGEPEWRILVVEDEAENSLLLCSLLERAGFAVCAVENGKQAVDAFREWHPHFIWMDRRMPVMDGIEATRAIRELPGGHNVKIVGLSASAFTDQREESLSAGMDDFVRKPYHSDEIYQYIAEHLGVKYVYRDIKPESQTGPAVLPALPSGALATLPVDLVQRLKLAILDLDTGRINAVVREIATVDPEVGRLLLAYAERFAYTKMLEALTAFPAPPLAGSGEGVNG